MSGAYYFQIIQTRLKKVLKVHLDTKIFDILQVEEQVDDEKSSAQESGETVDHFEKALNDEVTINKGK